MKTKKSIRFLKFHTNAVYGNVWLGRVVHDVKSDDADALVKAGLAEYCDADAKSPQPGGKDIKTPVPAKVTASKPAIELAEKHKIDLAKVTGTAKDGSITKPDVEKYLAELEAKNEVKADEETVKFADEYGVDLAKVTGTGDDGLITMEDVEKFLDDNKTA